MYVISWKYLKFLKLLSNTIFFIVPNKFEFCVSKNGFAGIRMDMTYFYFRSTI